MEDQKVAADGNGKLERTVVEDRATDARNKDAVTFRGWWTIADGYFGYFIEFQCGDVTIVQRYSPVQFADELMVPARVLVKDVHETIVLSLRDDGIKFLMQQKGTVFDIKDDWFHFDVVPSDERPVIGPVIRVDEDYKSRIACSFSIKLSYDELCALQSVLFEMFFLEEGDVLSCNGEVSTSDGQSYQVWGLPEPEDGED